MPLFFRKVKMNILPIKIEIGQIFIDADNNDILIVNTEQKEIIGIVFTPDYLLTTPMGFTEEQLRSFKFLGHLRDYKYEPEESENSNELQSDKTE